MKVVFIGPSGAGLNLDDRADGIIFAGPARMGDVAASVLAGATVIGLVDGTFSDHAAVWHKEILFALSQGVQVLGAASMGALRAAECASFGMVGIGTIFKRFAVGELIDDDAVALIHGPAELGWPPLSEALVNADATVDGLAARALVSADEADVLHAAATRIFFADRTFAAVANLAIDEQPRRLEITALLRAHRRDLKAEDAALLLESVAGLRPARTMPPEHWTFIETLDWQTLLRFVKHGPDERFRRWP